MKQGVEVKTEWSRGFKQNLEDSFGNGGLLQRWIDAAILESIEPYLPRDTGQLVASGLLHTRIGSGILVWKTPYARYLYEGYLMVDPKTGKGAFHDPVSVRFWSRPGITKELTKTPLSFHGGGKRGSKWPEKWMSDNLNEFETNLQKKAGELLRRMR